MAEPLAIFGGAAAALQITEMFIKLGKVFGTAENLSMDITFFCVNIINMSRILPTLYTAADNSINYLEELEIPIRQKLLDGLVLQFEMVSTRLDELAKRLGLWDEPVDRNETYPGYNWRVRLKWLLAKSDITGAQLMQETTKQSAQLLLTTLMCEGLVSRIRALEAQGGNEDAVNNLRSRK
jgi:hypothetical protein